MLLRVLFGAGVLVLTALAILVVVIRVSYKSHLEVALSVPFQGPSYSHVERAAARLCDAVSSDAHQKHVRTWRAQENAYRSAGRGSRVTGDTLVRHKLTHWSDPSSGAVGKDRVLCAGYLRATEDVRALRRPFDAWASRCTFTLLFVPATAIEGVPTENVVEVKPPGKYTPKNAWRRLVAIVTYLNEWPRLESSQFDAVLFFSEFSIVSVPNLQAMLREPELAGLSELGVPLFLGHRMATDAGVAFVNTASFVLNRVALGMLSVMLDAGACSADVEAADDDVKLAQCLGVVGVRPLDTYDVAGSDRVLMFSVDYVTQIAEQQPDAKSWYDRYRGRPFESSGGARGSVSMYPVVLPAQGPEEFDQTARKWLQRGAASAL